MSYATILGLSLPLLLGGINEGPIAGDAAAARARPAAEVAMPAELGRRVQDITETVLLHHIDPPARQQMILDGIHQLYQASGLPVHRGGRARARVAFGAPLQMGIAAEAELADIVLTEFVPTWSVREALSDRLPEGFALPPGFSVEEAPSKTFDFSHVSISYPGKPGAPNERVDAEGKTWTFILKLVPANRTADATDATMNIGSVQQRLNDLGMAIVASERRSQAYLQTFVDGEIEKWARVIKTAGVSAD